MSECPREKRPSLNAPKEALSVDTLKVRDPHDALITRRYRLTQVNEAFAALEKGELARGVITF